MHDVCVGYNDKTLSQTRPLIQMNVKYKKNTFALFVCHWKSKRSNSQVINAGEQLRLLQEGQLAFYMEDCKSKGVQTIACGDFNMDIDGFCHAATSEKVFLRSPFVALGGTDVKSLWYMKENIPSCNGSYFFNKTWERIDNFFVSDDVDIIDFSPCTKGAWCYSNSFIPKKYHLYNGSGYSDHLPIKCIIKI